MSGRILRVTVFSHDVVFGWNASCHSARREVKISSFSTEIDNIGEKEGYGSGEYTLRKASGELGYGADFNSIIRYFAAKRGNKTFNCRADVSPPDLKDYLPWIALMEPIWGQDGVIEDAKVNLHGSAAAAAFSDVTGKCVKAVHKRSVANRVIASLNMAAKQKCGVIGASEERDGPPPHVRLTMLYLPLSNDDNHISHFFAYGRIEPLRQSTDG